MRLLPARCLMRLLPVHCRDIARLPSSIWIENTMSGAKRKCSNDQTTSAWPTSPSVSSPTLHSHHSLEPRARPCSVEPQQLVSHDVVAKLRPLIIELIKGSLQPYTAKMGNMEPQHIAKLVSSDVNEKLKPLIYQQTIQCVESYIAMVGSEDPKHIASKVSLHVLPQPGLLVHHQNSPSVVEPQLLQAQHLADQPHLCLRFSELEKMPPHFWAETKLKNVDGFPTQVELVDARTGNVVSNGAESSATFHVVVLEGSSGAEVEADIDKGNWKELVVKPRDGRKSLLVGGLKVTLKEGKGSLDTNLRFKDNSSFVSSKKFRLGLEDISGSHIQGAVTNAFHVKDARGKSNGKKEVPAENDTLDVLVHIAKGGARLHHLNSVFKITTVKEFNLFYKENPKALRAGLNRLSDESFAAIIENAERCQQEEPGLQSLFIADAYRLRLVDMAQKQTTNGYCVKEGSAMISMSPDASGVLKSGVNNEFNLPEQQQSIFLGDPAGDHVIRKEDLQGTSQSGIPGGVLPSPALQQNSQLLESPPHTDPWSNGTAFDIPDDLLMEDGLTIDEIPFGYFHGSTVPFT
ncbi:unnamed protein product [Sphagnum troendelagicum]|uniref:Calmodulin-binding protein n=1 Tax=Sphagnum troendelagicum TaxID=128251 RepID=A0ABP0TGX3_9BRYO